MARRRSPLGAVHVRSSFKAGCENWCELMAGDRISTGGVTIGFFGEIAIS